MSDFEHAELSKLLSDRPALSDLDKLILHQALDSLLGTYLTTQGLSAVLNVSEKLGIHREPLCCRIAAECPLLVLWEQYEQGSGGPRSEQ